jgi:hypothetical protein
MMENDGKLWKMMENDGKWGYDLFIFEGKLSKPTYGDLN